MSMIPSQWPVSVEEIVKVIYLSDIPSILKFLGYIFKLQFPITEGCKETLVRVSLLFWIFQTISLEEPTLMKPKLTNGSKLSFPACGMTWIGISHS